MATPQLSPGVIVREVDLTVGRAENVLDNIGAIAGPFPIGPVNEPYLIRTQQELINVFGKPMSTDRQYEYWMSASSFLTYGGILKVVRTSGTTLNNANAGVGVGTDTSLLIENKDDYELNYETSTDFTYSARNPGSWAQDLKVCFIDNVTDQTIGVTTTSLADMGVQVGYSVTATKSNITIPGDGTTSTFTGQLRGIVTGIRTDSINGNSSFDVKVLERVAPDTTSYNLELTTNVSVAITAEKGVANGIGTDIVFLDSVTGIAAGDVINLEPGIGDAGQINNPIVSVGASFVQVATAIAGTVTKAPAQTVSIAVTAGDVSSGLTTVFIANTDGIVSLSVEVGNYFTGCGLNQALITGVGTTSVTLSTGVGATALVGAAVTVEAIGILANSVATVSGVTTTAGAVTPVTYQEYNSAASFMKDDSVIFEDGNELVTGTTILQSATDWYDEQTLNLTNSTVFWKTIAPRPISSNYVTSRGGTNDSLHIAVVDDTGNVTGIQGNILEKSLFLSKALDAAADGENPLKTYYKNWITKNSDWIFAGYNVSQATDNYWGTTPTAVGFSTNNTPVSTGDGLWGQDAQGVTFSGIGNVTYNLSGGVDYTANGGMEATLGSLATSYRYFTNKDDEAVDYLIMGPGLSAEADSQAKANLLISLAQGRKDCIATISPHRANVVNVTNSATQTQNVLQFYSPVSSSSYAILDSGYKYTFDRFNNRFVYIPTNGDVAGLCVRTSIDSYPWFSPAGLQRGVINNAVKLAYNPDKDQRDLLYAQRINPIVTKQGAGTVLFGDKTALGYASAFDRINVRRLFLTVEQALEGASESTLFELNDSLTRANFVNIVEPYLRDVQAKRGVYDFLIVCDETNNTPDVIDNNEFRADIFLQPAKSINFITLTFVATRTGIDFSEVVGTV
jgi:hypothetical protein